MAENPDNDDFPTQPDWSLVSVEHDETTDTAGIISVEPISNISELEELFLFPEGQESVETPQEANLDDPYGGETDIEEELHLKITDVRSEADTSKETLGDDNEQETDTMDITEGQGQGAQATAPDSDTISRDKRSEKLGGHFTKMMNFFTNVAHVAENDYILLDKGDRPKESTLQFAHDLVEVGEDMIKAGQCFIAKGTKIKKKYERAVIDWEKSEHARKFAEDAAAEKAAGASAGGDVTDKPPEPKKQTLSIVLPKVVASVQKIQEKQKAQMPQKKNLKICAICNATFKDQRLLDDHSRMHSGDKLSCEICHQKFTSSQRYHEHMRDHREGPYKCPYCNAVLPKKGSFYNHVYQIHEAEPMLCDHPKCGRVFTRKQNYEDHVEFGHRPTKDVQCDECPKKCQTKAALRTHKSMDHPTEARRKIREERKKARSE